MKKVFIPIFFLTSIILNAQSVVFSAQNGASLTIADNASVNFNGVKFSPTTTFQLTDNLLSLSNIPLSETFTSTKRIYTLNSSVSYSGEIKVFYDDSVEELNGLDESTLNIAVQGTDSNWAEVNTTLDVTSNTVSANFNASDIMAIALVESGSILSVITNNDNKIRVYPNPVSSNLYVDSTESYFVKIYDLNGKLVLDQKVNGVINMSNFSSSTYFMTLFDSNKVLLDQFTVIKK